MGREGKGNNEGMSDEGEKHQSRARGTELGWTANGTGLRSLCSSSRACVASPGSMLISEGVAASGLPPSS